MLAGVRISYHNCRSDPPFDTFARLEVAVDGLVPAGESGGECWLRFSACHGGISEVGNNRKTTATNHHSEYLSPVHYLLSASLNLRDQRSSADVLDGTLCSVQYTAICSRTER